MSTIDRIFKHAAVLRIQSGDVVIDENTWKGGRYIPNRSVVEWRCLFCGDILHNQRSTVLYHRVHENKFAYWIACDHCKHFLDGIDFIESSREAQKKEIKALVDQL